MAYKFFEISKANEEITRLESALADRDAALKAAQERITSLETQESAKEKDKPAAQSEREKQLEADLNTAKQTIKSLETQVETLKGDVVKAKADADKLASQKAAQITAAQGQPPIDVKPAETPAKTAANGNWTERCLAAKAANVSK